MAIALAGGIIAGNGVVMGAAHVKANTPSLVAVSGSARIVDGDTIEVAGRRVRLEGIDAPEAGQTCPGRYVGGILGPWRCGDVASAALQKLIGSKPVTCKAHKLDKYRRLVATCFAGRREINRSMVLQGHAWAFTRYSARYVEEEARARAAKAGIWASTERAQPAWEYRSRRWARAEQKAPEGCAIKGNISARGEHIYHAPWSPWYGKVRINAAAGERWFCDEAQAIAAGFRPARVR